jgi:succinate-semialdehyde dehydrogenase / glutarate-semialdehyde dehydrogenase
VSADVERKVLIPLKDPSLWRQRCYVDGNWVLAGDGGTFEVNNPATGQRIGDVPRMSAPPSNAPLRQCRRGEPAPRKIAPTCCVAGST